MATGTNTENDFAAVFSTWSKSVYITKDISIIRQSTDEYAVQSHCIKNFKMVHEASPTSASNLDWVINSLLKETIEIRKNLNTTVYDFSDHAGESVSPSESNIIFLPFVYGNNLGIRADSCLLGMNANHTIPHILRAVYEGIVFCHKQHIDKIFKVRHKPEFIRFADGAAKSSVWMQMFADCLEIPVATMEATELGAFGAAVCAGVASGTYRDFEDASRSVMRINNMYEPNVLNSEHYREKYQEYCEIAISIGKITRGM